MVKRECKKFINLIWLCITFLCFCFCSLKLFSTVVGAEDAVSIESSAPTFPAADNDNLMRGFCWLKAGFTLEDAATTCTFSGAFPITGTVDLNGGTLYLTQDLIFKNSSTLQGLGSIVGDDHLVDLCSSITYLPSDTQEFTDVTIDFHHDLSISSTITFKGQCLLYGNGNSLLLNGSGELVADQDATLELRDLVLENLSDSNVRCVDDTGIIILDDVRLYFDNDFSFTCGRIKFVNQVDFLGSHTFSYESGQTSTISQNSCWHITDDLHLSIGRKEAVDYVEPLSFVDDTSIFKLDNCSLLITASGMQLTKGKIEFDREVIVDGQSTSTDTGVVVGTGLEDDDFIMHFNSGAIVSFRTGHFSYNNYAANKIRSLSYSSRLTRLEGSELVVLQNVTFPEMTAEIISLTAPPTTTIASGKTLHYENSTIVLPTVEFDITGYMQNSITYLLNGNDSIFFSRGNLPLALIIQNSGNSLKGNGSFSGALALANSDAELTCSIDGLVLCNIALNNGKLILGHDLEFGEGYRFSNSGNVDLSTYNLGFSSKDISWSDASIYWAASDAYIDLYSRVSLSSTWTFSGVTTIYGHGNVLDLGSSGEIIVEEGSHLTFKDIALKGIFSDNIRCLDDNGIITLDNVAWMQDGNYTFSIGALEFKDEVKMQGGYIFVYQTNQTSTIQSQSSLKLDQDFTFSYDPVRLALKDLLAFEDSSSELILSGATFHTTTTGIQLKTGKIKVKRNSSLASEVDGELDEGITVGTGTEAEDFTLDILNGFILSVTNGSLNYKNINCSSCNFCCRAVLQMYANTVLRLYQDLDVGNGSATFQANTTLARASGKGIVGSVTAYGELAFTTL